MLPTVYIESGWQATPRAAARSTVARISATPKRGARAVRWIAAANWPAISQQILEMQVPDLDERAQAIAAETVVDPGVALQWATVELADVPEGWAAIPAIASMLSPARKRELILRIAVLVYAALVYAKVMAGIELGEDDATAGALLAVAWLCHTVLSSIEDAEDLLRDEQEDKP